MKENDFFYYYFVQLRGKHFGLDYLPQFRFDLSLQYIKIKKAIQSKSYVLK